MQSEGELTIASTGKDPTTGKLVSHEYRVEGPVMIVLTTTAVEIDDELLNRCLVLTVDEDREQTRAIHRRQRERQALAGLLADHEWASGHERAGPRRRRRHLRLRRSPDADPLAERDTDQDRDEHAHVDPDANVYFDSLADHGAASVRHRPERTVASFSDCTIEFETSWARG